MSSLFADVASVLRLITDRFVRYDLIPAAKVLLLVFVYLWAIRRIAESRSNH